MDTTHTVTNTGKGGTSPITAFVEFFRDDTMFEWDVKDVINVLRAAWNNGVCRRTYFIRMDLPNKRLLISGGYKTGFPCVAALHIQFNGVIMVELLSKISTTKTLGVAPCMGDEYIQGRLLVELNRAVEEYLTKGGCNGLEA